MNDNLKKLIDSLDKEYGAGSIQRMGDSSKKMETISTGRISLDIALGGGWAKGKIVEIYSEEGCGKSGIVLTTIAQAQMQGIVCAYIDSEYALEESYARRLGVDWDNLYLVQPTNGNEAFDISRKLAASGEIGLIAYDSTSTMIPKAELEAENGQASMGLQARMFSQGLRQITSVAANNDCTLLFISQQRDKIGSYVPTKSVGSGNAMKFYASQRVEIKKTLLRKGTDVIGFTQKFKVTKNKTAPAYKTCSIDISYESGIDEVQELLDVATENDICQRKGAWFYYDETKLGQGKENAADLLRGNPELQDEILSKIKFTLSGD